MPQRHNIERQQGSAGFSGNWQLVTGNWLQLSLIHISFYLDECFDCQEVRTVLDAKGARYRVYSEDVAANSGIQDESIIPHIGTRIFITIDADQRRKKRVQYELRRYRIRAFVLPANLSGHGKAQLLGRCKNRIFEFCRNNDAPFIAYIDKRGAIHLRVDKDGRTHGRRGN